MGDKQQWLDNGWKDAGSYGVVELLATEVGGDILQYVQIVDGQAAGVVKSIDREAVFELYEFLLHQPVEMIEVRPEDLKKYEYVRLKYISRQSMYGFTTGSIYNAELRQEGETAEYITKNDHGELGTVAFGKDIHDLLYELNGKFEIIE